MVGNDRVFATKPKSAVTFYVNGTTTVLGTGNVEQSAGATVANLNFCTTATQATGTYTVYGVYGGDSNYNASQLSNPVTFVITN